MHLYNHIVYYNTKTIIIQSVSLTFYVNFLNSQFFRKIRPFYGKNKGGDQASPTLNFFI